MNKQYIDLIEAERNLGLQPDDTPGGESLRAAVTRLAALPEIEYLECRKKEAKRFGVPAAGLDRTVKAARGDFEQDDDDLGLFEPERWPEEVDGADMLDRIVAGIRIYVVVPDQEVRAVALWVVHAHCFTHWQHTPRLSVMAPEKGCGKSTLLDVLALLVPRGLKTESLSTAVMFRIVDGHTPILLIDEVDAYLSGRNPDEELRAALNAGHARGGRHLRCVGDDNQVKGFKTFAPAALAGIGRLPGTLADRSIPINLNRRKPDEPVSNFRESQAGHLRELASQAARWAADHEAKLQGSEPAMPPGVHNRQADNWRALLAIADVAGGEWPEQARQDAIALCGRAEQDDDSIGVMLLSDLRTIFENHGAVRLPSRTICADLADMEERPWPEFTKARKPITPTQVSKLLGRYGIAPNTVREGTKTNKGYKLEDLQNALARYVTEPRKQTKAGLHPFPAVTPSQPAENCHFSQFPAVTNELDVTAGNREKPQKSSTCDGVTARNRGRGALCSFSGNSEDLLNGRREATRPPANRSMNPSMAKILGAISEGEGDREEREAIMAIDGA